MQKKKVKKSKNVKKRPKLNLISETCRISKKLKKHGRRVKNVSLKISMFCHERQALVSIRRRIILPNNEKATYGNIREL